MKNIGSLLMVMVTLILASLACGSLEVGVVTPTSESETLNILGAQETTPEVGLGMPSPETNLPTVHQVQ